MALAVVTEDKKAIAKANGIGPKIAARIILELHDKLAATAGLPDISAATDSGLSAPAAGASSALRDAQEALLVLGYTRSEILNALQGMDVSKLYVSQCFVTPARTAKRIQPRAQGRAFRILKRSSHITLAVAEKQ